MQYKVIEDEEEAGVWHVEAIDEDGGCHFSLFIAEDAERRAREYAAWMNTQVAKEPVGLTRR